MKYQYTVNIVTTTLVGVLQIILLPVSKKVLKLFGRIIPLMIFTLIIASSNFNGSAVVSSFSSAGSSNTGGQKQIQVRILFKMYYIIIHCSGISKLYYRISGSKKPFVCSSFQVVVRLQFSCNVIQQVVNIYLDVVILFRPNNITTK